MKNITVNIKKPKGVQVTVTIEVPKVLAKVSAKTKEKPQFSRA